MGRRGAWAATLAPFVIALVVFGVWLQKVQPPVVGDEGCYLAQAYSLARDHDLDLRDDFQADAPVTRLTGNLKDGSVCGADYRHDGKLRSVFNPGVGMLLAPAARVLAVHTTHLRWTMVAVAALWAQQMWVLIRGLTSRLGAAVVAWSGTLLLLPALGFANQLLPEVPGALGLTVCANCVLRVDRGRAWRAAAGLALAPLPWLHTRFGGLAAVLVLLPIFAGQAASGGATSIERVRSLVRRRWLVPMPLVVSVVALGVLYRHLYGSVLPSAPYRAKTGSLVALTPLQSYRGGIGTLLGPSSGLGPVNPFLFLGLIGLGLVAVRWRRAGPLLVVAFALQLFVVSPLGFFGYTLPGRFAIVLLPLIGVGAALVLDRVRLAMVPAVAQIALGLVVVAISWNRYGQLYDVGRPQLASTRHTAWAWPRVEPYAGARDAGFMLVANDQSVGAPALAVGPEFELRTGDYGLAADLTGDAAPHEPGPTLRVRNVSSGGIVGQVSFTWSAAADGQVTAGPVLRIRAPDAARLRVELDEGPVRTFRTAVVTVTPSGRTAPATAPIRRGLPVGALWASVIVALATWAAVVEVRGTTRSTEPRRAAGS